MLKHGRMSCVCAALSSVLLLAGCALEVTSEEQELSSEPYDEAEDVEAAVAAILNGSRDYTQRGMVEIYVQEPLAQSQICSGTLLNKHWILTAMHCVSPLPNFERSDKLRATVSYFDPDFGAKRVISAAPANENADNLFAVISPLANCIYAECEDPGSDVVLIRNGATTAVPWEGAATGAPAHLKLEAKDFMRFNGTSSASEALDVLFKDFRLLTVFGRGPVADNGAGFGTLRSMEGFIETWSSARIDMVVNTKGICHGDSGGSFVGSFSGFQVIAGVTASADDFSGACADANELQYAARIDRHASWIKDTIGGCTSFESQYTRCW
jgi:hypothetical protein